MSNQIVEESVLGKVGTVTRKISNTTDVMNKWHRGISQRSKQKKVIKNVTDEEYDNLSDWMKKVRTVETYKEYKPYFDKICEYAGISPKGVIITDMKLQKKGNDKNIFMFEYSANQKKIQIPSDSALYHISNVHDIKELVPQFRGKSAKGYLYSYPRVYFSIRKKMPKIFADYTKKDNKLSKYVVRENIRTAFVDPLIWLYPQGAVYIETRFPIKVDKVIEEKPVKECVFESVDDFANYYGLEEIFDDENEVTESVKSFVGSVVRKSVDGTYIRDTWNQLAKNFETNHIIRKLKGKEVEEAKKNYEIMKEEDKSFMKYKSAFNKLCKILGLPNNETIIERVTIDKDKDGDDEINVRYSKGKRKFMVPNGVTLIHVSPMDNLRELKPSFKSKVKGKYMYSSSRVFFTLSKDISKNKAGLEHQTLHRYTPKENIRVVFIDQTYRDYGTGAVYVETRFPIPANQLK